MADCDESIGEICTNNSCVLPVKKCDDCNIPNHCFDTDNGLGECKFSYAHLVWIIITSLIGLGLLIGGAYAVFS